MGLILLIILILLLLGAVPRTGSYSADFGYAPGGFIVLLLIIVLIVVLSGRLAWWF